MTKKLPLIIIALSIIVLSIFVGINFINQKNLSNNSQQYVTNIPKPISSDSNNYAKSVFVPIPDDVFRNK